MSGVKLPEVVLVGRELVAVFFSKVGLLVLVLFLNEVVLDLGAVLVLPETEYFILMPPAVLDLEDGAVGIPSLVNFILLESRRLGGRG